MTGASLLELLHPDGHAGRVRVIGGNCPAEALPCPEEHASAGPADLVIVAPRGDECERPAWIEEAAARAASTLAAEGVVYVVASPRCRHALARLLARRGLSITERFHHHPAWPASTTVIPLQWRTMAYAYTHLIRTDPRRRRVALRLLALPGALAALALLLPSMGLAMRRTSSTPLFAWLAAEAAERAQPVAGIVHGSWRGSGGAVIVHGFSGRERLPSRIAKTWLRPRSDAQGDSVHAREAANLESVAREACHAGVEVPRLLREGRLCDRPVLVETAVRGTAAAALLDRHPERLPGVLSSLAGWLERWNRASAVRRPMARDLLAEALLHPAAALAGDIGAGPAYMAALEAMCGAAAGQDVPLVAAHNDLTMVNVLLMGGNGAGDSRLGVIDWEDAGEQCLPLGDFFYSAVDAVAAARDYADRRAAFTSCFAPGGEWADLVASLGARLCRSLGLTDEVAAVCFHACWLRYAFNARERGMGKEARHFIDIARAVAEGAVAPRPRLETAP